MYSALWSNATCWCTHPLAGYAGYVGVEGISLPTINVFPKNNIEHSTAPISPALIASNWNIPTRHPESLHSHQKRMRTSLGIFNDTFAIGQFGHKSSDGISPQLPGR